MTLDEETLERVADDGRMDYDKWPAIVDPLLERINLVIQTEFPTPKPYPNIYPSTQTLSPQQPPSHLNTPQTQATTPNGPTIPATPTPSRNLPPVPLFPSTSANNTPTTSQIPDSLPPDTQPSDDQPPELPPPIVQLLDGIVKTLKTSFSALPPHTIQRLAELILNPTKHYRTLPAWLRAVDRVISVTSTADIFPLPRAMALPSHVIDSSLLVNGVHGADADKSVLSGGGGGILWSNDSNSDWNNEANTMLGSDESLGGALLTPIPWLRNGVSGQSSSEDSRDLDSGESDDLLGGPIEMASVTTAITAHGNALVPEREDGAVTQGELIRQEQEAGVVPVGHSSADSRGMMLEDDDDDDSDDNEETLHARGPGVMGAVDVGMVNGRGMEVNVSESGVGTGVRDAQEVLSGGIPTPTPRSANDAMEIDFADPLVQMATGMAGVTEEAEMAMHAAEREAEEKRAAGGGDEEIDAAMDETNGS